MYIKFIISAINSLVASLEKYVASETAYISKLEDKKNKAVTEIDVSIEQSSDNIKAANKLLTKIK